MNDLEYKKYLKIIERYRAGKAVPKEDLKFMVEFSTTANPKAVDDYIKKAKDNGEWYKLSGDQQKELESGAAIESIRQMLTDPSYKQDIVELARDAEKGRVSAKIQAGLNTILTGADIVSSVGQINAANQAAKRVRRPTRPAPLTASPELQNAIVQAQQGNYDAVRALEPAKLAILDNYLSDLNNAKTASTGQAGQFGAMAQVASSRRNRANLALAPLGDTIAARNQQRLDNLLQMKLNENQNIQQSQAQFYPNDLLQYNTDLQRADALGATGRTNLRTAVTDFSRQIPGAVANYAVDPKYDQIINSMNMYGDKNAQAAAEAYQHVSNYYNGAPGTLNNRTQFGTPVAQFNPQRPANQFYGYGYGINQNPDFNYQNKYYP